jgi:hypothetical protein
MQKFFYLSAAGYKHELVAAAQAAAARLLAEGSSVQLDTVLIAGRILEEEALKRGNFEKSEPLPLCIRALLCHFEPFFNETEATWASGNKTSMNQNKQ